MKNEVAIAALKEYLNATKCDLDRLETSIDSYKEHIVELKESVLVKLSTIKAYEDAIAHLEGE